MSRPPLDARALTIPPRCGAHATSILSLDAPELARAGAPSPMAELTCVSPSITFQIGPWPSPTTRLAVGTIGAQRSAPGAPSHLRVGSLSFAWGGRGFAGVGVRRTIAA